MKVLLVLAMFVPSALGNICCMPDKFWARTVSGYEWTVDFVAQKMYRDSRPVWEEIYDLSNNKLYLFLANGTCDQLPLKGFVFSKQCIPDDATFIANRSIAWDKDLHSEYRYNVSDDTQIEMVVSSKCHPLVSLEYHGDSQTPIINGWRLFKNTIGGSVFDKDYKKCLPLD